MMVFAQNSNSVANNPLFFYNFESQKFLSSTQSWNT